MKSYVIVKGQRFEVLGPVDRRRSVEFSPHGRAICPYCADAGRTQIGPFLLSSTSYRQDPAYSESQRALLDRMHSRTRRYFVEHLKRDHYRCTKKGCGWIGIVPGQHVVRSPNHKGPISYRKRPRRASMRITTLLGGTLVALLLASVASAMPKLVRVPLGHGIVYVHPVGASSRVACTSPNANVWISFDQTEAWAGPRWHVNICFTGEHIRYEALVTKHDVECAYDGATVARISACA